MSTRSLADALSERLLDTFPADQAYTKADWATDAMPGPLRHYLTHLLRHHHRREARQLRRARTDWVDYDHPEMEQATHAFLNATEQHLQVPRDQWTDTLRTAARRTTNYLVRPVPTLRAFVFEDAAGAVPVPQVQWRMRFFGPYAHLRNAVQAFADKQDRDAFTPDAFERVLRRVDERMTADFDADRWLDLLDPLFDTARCATDLHRPTDEASAPQSNSSSEAAPEATPMWKQFEQDARPRRTETDASNDDAQPLWAQFQQRPSDGSRQTSASSPPPGADSSSSSDGRSTASDPDDALSALEREVFGPSHTPKREVYVDALFDGDRDAYRRVLKRLRTVDSWSDASQIISDDVFRPYQVNIYSDAAVHFTNAIEATFR
ncbi:hypothetical protein [Salinibacter pepae]|uniref:hypothetical protein n=1 Tax=Salinibacter pepae TaxID=3040382 RepID=UPI0021E7AC9F|nr:hypothetical protein [Salinibacter pepae]